MAKLLPIADSPRTVIFREFCRLVTLDGEMQRIGVAFRTWEGNPDDDQPPGNVDQLPWMRFSPAGGRQRPDGLKRIAAPMEIHVDMLTPGLDVADSMNLWETFERLVLSPPFRSAMKAAGAVRVFPAEAAFGVSPSYPKHEPVIPGAIFAAGSIEIDTHRPA